jgi:hypothetical protein
MDLLNRCIPTPTEEQRQAMAVTSQYLARAHAQAGTQLLIADIWAPGWPDANELYRGMEQAASLVDALVEMHTEVMCRVR